MCSKWADESNLHGRLFELSHANVLALLQRLVRCASCFDLALCAAVATSRACCALCRTGRMTTDSRAKLPLSLAWGIEPVSCSALLCSACSAAIIRFCVRLVRISLVDSISLLSADSPRSRSRSRCSLQCANEHERCTVQFVHGKFVLCPQVIDFACLLHLLVYTVLTHFFVCSISTRST